MRFLRAPAALAVALALSACATVGPDYARPATPLPAAFPGEAATAGSPAPELVATDGWKLFGDAQLDALVEAALARNTDLLQAAARVEQADALLREAGGALFPTVNANSSASRARRFVNGQPMAPVTGLGLSLSTAFEIDFWGKLRRATESARAQALASRHAQEVVRLSVAGLTAQAYFSLRSLDEQIDITRETLRTRDENLRVLRSRVEAGVSGRLDLDQAQALRADSAVLLRELQRQRALAASQLGLLAGEPGLALGEGQLGQSLPRPPAGLSSALLARRPDVQAAEQQLVAANAQVGVARAAMFPTLSLTSALGTESAELSNLLDSGSRIWSLGFGLTVPLFDGGRLAARTDRAWGVQREAIAAYQGAVQSAFRDTADALASLGAARESEADVQQRWQASANALKLAQMRYDAGYSAYVELLEAQRSANAARLEVVRNRAAQLAATVDLWRALGGGWSAQPIAQAGG